MEIPYKKRKPFEILKLPNKECNIDTVISIISSIIKNSHCQIDYFSLYNNLYLLNDVTVFKTLIEKTTVLFKEQLNAMTNEITAQKSYDNKLISLFSSISEISKKTETIRKIILTNRIRFNKEITQLFNNSINVKSMLKDFENQNSDLYDKIKNYCISLINNKEKLRKCVELVRKSCSSKIYLDILTQLSELKIEEYKKEISLCDITSTDNLSEYFTHYNKKLEEEINFFGLLFGDQEANTLKEKLIEIIFLDKLSNNIFNNEELLEKMLNENDYMSLKNIEKLSRRKTNSMKTFQNLFFDFYYKYFNRKIHVPKTSSLKEGLLYVKELIDYTSQLISIFKNVFNYSRQVQLKYNETLLKMTNSSNVKHFELLLSIFINENLYSNESIIYDPSLLVIMHNVNGKDIFFSNIIKLTIKRLASMKFILAKEEKFEMYLRANFETIYIHKLTRIIKDIKENNNLSEDGSITFNLLSFGSLIKNELIQILNLDSKCPFNPMVQKYNLTYPHRKILISQIYSSAQITFNKKVDIVVNFIQAKILEFFNKNKSLTYDNIISLLGVSNQYISIVRGCIQGLLQCQILIKDNDKGDLLKTDLLKPNLNLETNKKVIYVIEKTFTILNKEIYYENSKKAQSEEGHINEESTYIQNKRFILECKIVKSTKQNVNGKLLESELIRNVIMDESIKELFRNNIDIVYIKKIIEALVERGFIKIEKENDKIYYKFSS